MRSTSARLYHDHMLTKEPGHAPADAVASRPALLQHRRHTECELLDPGRPREPRLHSGVRRGLAPRAHGSCRARSWTRQAKWFPEGSSPICRISRRGARLSHSRLGARARRCRVLSHADAACLARRRGTGAGAFSPCASWAMTSCMHRGAGRPRRSSRAREELPAGAPMHHAAVSRIVARAMTPRPRQGPAPVARAAGSSARAAARTSTGNLVSRGAGARRHGAPRLSRRRAHPCTPLRSAMAASREGVVRFADERPQGGALVHAAANPRGARQHLRRHEALGRSHARHDGPRARLHQSRPVRVRGRSRISRRGRIRASAPTRSATTSICASTTCASRTPSFRRRRTAPSIGAPGGPLSRGPRQGGDRRRLRHPRDAGCWRRCRSRR
jgi:hypothetical protein